MKKNFDFGEDYLVVFSKADKDEENLDPETYFSNSSSHKMRVESQCIDVDIIHHWTFIGNFLWNTTPKPEGAEVKISDFCPSSPNEDFQSIFSNFASFYPENTYVSFDDSCSEAGGSGFKVYNFNHLDYSGDRYNKLADDNVYDNEYLYQFGKGKHISAKTLKETAIKARSQCSYKYDFDCFFENLTYALPEHSLVMLQDRDDCEGNIGIFNSKGSVYVDIDEDDDFGFTLWNLY